MTGFQYYNTAWYSIWLGVTCFGAFSLGRWIARRRQPPFPIVNSQIPELDDTPTESPVNNDPDAELAMMLYDLDVPLMRVVNRDWAWISRNLGLTETNRNHPDYPKIMGMIRERLRG